MTDLLRSQTRYYIMERQRVDHQGIAEQVHVLASMAHTVGPAKIEGVLDCPVDGLGVAAPAGEPLEVRIARRDAGRSRYG